MANPWKQLRKKVSPFAQPIEAKPYIPPPESMHWFWNPNRIDVTFAPDWFLKRVREIDSKLTITWDRYQERWLVWVQSPRFQSKLCSGWILLFPVRYDDGSYCPLDERIFARLYHASEDRWGNAKHYFNAIQREQERDKEKAYLNRDDNIKHAAGEYYDYMKIKNYGLGSKFVNHFSG